MQNISSSIVTLPVSDSVTHVWMTLLQLERCESGRWQKTCSLLKIHERVVSQIFESNLKKSAPAVGLDHTQSGRTALQVHTARGTLISVVLSAKKNLHWHGRTLTKSSKLKEQKKKGKEIHKFHGNGCKKTSHKPPFFFFFLNTYSEQILGKLGVVSLFVWSYENRAISTRCQRAAAFSGPFRAAPECFIWTVNNIPPRYSVNEPKEWKQIFCSSEQTHFLTGKEKHRRQAAFIERIKTKIYIYKYCVKYRQVNTRPQCRCVLWKQS